jgi:DNA-binding transcriptional MerR regulator
MIARKKTTATRSSTGGTDVEGKGPSLGDSGAMNVRVSAAQLADLARVLPHDIQYWGRLGYLTRGEVENGDERLYMLSQLPKAQLMALFTKRLQIRAKKAAELSDELLRQYEDRPDAFEATVGMVQLLESRITAFVDLILELKLLPRIGELLKEAPS